MENNNEKMEHLATQMVGSFQHQLEYNQEARLQEINIQKQRNRIEERKAVAFEAIVSKFNVMVENQNMFIQTLQTLLTKGNEEEEEEEEGPVLTEEEVKNFYAPPHTYNLRKRAH
jgi:YD repeat-containing protein